jgi:SAM-dependent methyltransferase
VEGIDRLYRLRFPERARQARERLWAVLCSAFFQKYVRAEDTLLDLGCGFGEFSRHIRAARRVAVDSNAAAAEYQAAGVEFHAAEAAELSFLAPASVDVCFTSNFFEHLPSKAEMDRVLAEVLRVLRPGGRFIALQPNLRYAPGAYWDYYDHHLPLTHRSCAEAFGKAGFEVEELIGRFLPLTTRSRWPQHPRLVRLYLALPPLWRLVGGQFLIVGRKPG